MNIRCLFGHDWRLLPRFKCRAGYDEDWTNPTKICMRCFKQWRERYFLYVRSIEGPGWTYYMPPYWEGQTPPSGYESWKQYREKARDGLLRRAK